MRIRYIGWMKVRCTLVGAAVWSMAQMAIQPAWTQSAAQPDLQPPAESVAQPAAQQAAPGAAPHADHHATMGDKADYATDRMSWAAPEIVACIQSNLPQNSSAQVLKLAATDRADSTRELQAHSWWQRSSEAKARVNMRLLAPPDLAKSSYLIAQSDTSTALFAYLPSLGRVQRVSGQAAAQQLWGTDFSYDDMRFVQGSAFDGQFTRLQDATVQERDVWVLAQQPAGESIYALVVSYVEPKTCVALQTDFYTKVNTGDREALPESPPRKRLTTNFNSIRKISAASQDSAETVRVFWLATELRMQDLQEQTHTTLTLGSIEFEPEFSSALFNPRSFYRVPAP